MLVRWMCVWQSFVAASEQATSSRSRQKKKIETMMVDLGLPACLLASGRALREMHLSAQCFNNLDEHATPHHNKSELVTTPMGMTSTVVLMRCRVADLSSSSVRSWRGVARRRQQWIRLTQTHRGGVVVVQTWVPYGMLIITPAAKPRPRMA